MSRFVAFLALGAVALLLGVALAAIPDAGEAGGVPFQVNSIGDAPDVAPGDDVCLTAGAVCTLRAAIEEANFAPSYHAIHFSLPSCPGAGCVITPLSPLPKITRGFGLVNGSSQLTPEGKNLVTLDGSLAGALASGIHLSGNSSSVEGMIIRDFTGAGVLVGEVAGSGPWMVADNWIEDNAFGIDIGSFCIGNTSVIGNTIEGSSTLGVSACGPDIIARFNRIYDNTLGYEDIGMSEFSTAENNWWGCNEGPIVGVDCDAATGAVDTDPWLTLRIKADPNAIPGGETSNLSGDLVINSDGFDTTGSEFIPNGTSVIFETNLGSVGSSSVVKETSSGGAAATLTADVGPGIATVKARIDGEEVSTTVGIVSAPPTPSPTATPTATPGPPCPAETAAPGATCPPCPGFEPVGNVGIQSTCPPTPSPTLTPTPTATIGLPCPGAPAASGATCPPCPTGVPLGNVDIQSTCPPIVTATPTPTPTTTPTTSPSGETMLWGDADCDGEITTRDNQSVLRKVLDQNPLSQEPGCPDLGEEVNVGGVERLWGDWDCDGEITTRDNQSVLRKVLDQNPLSQEPGCPDLGTEVVVD